VVIVKSKTELIIVNIFIIKCLNVDKTNNIQYVSFIQWNLDLTKCQGTGEMCSLYRKPRYNEFVENNQNVRYIEV